MGTILSWLTVLSPVFGFVSCIGACICAFASLYKFSSEKTCEKVDAVGRYMAVIGAIVMTLCLLVNAIAIM